MMKRLQLAALVFSILGGVTFVASFAVESNYAGRAELVQRVRRDAATDLFGDGGTPVGSPQLLIISDRKAFTGQKTSDGAAEVDEAYLERTGIYPLQMKTVSYVALLARVAGGILAVGMAALVAYLRRRAPKTA